MTSAPDSEISAGISGEGRCDRARHSAIAAPTQAQLALPRVRSGQAAASRMKRVYASTSPVSGLALKATSSTLSGPGVQAETDTATAVRKARQANDFLAEKTAAEPRYRGFAHLAMQDPAAAADELERSVRELGLVGAMINGQTNGAYLDDDRFSIFWERAADLGAPVYIHPYNPPDFPYMFHNHPELYGPVWSWTVETGNHALRLIFGGVFDRYPEARLILGILNDAWSENWGYVPLTDSEVAYVGKNLKKIVYEDLVMVAEYDGEPVAFMIVLPHVNEKLIFLLVALHVAAIVFYRLRKGKNLVRTMVTGDGPADPGTPPSRDDAGLRILALVLLAACAAAVWYLVTVVGGGPAGDSF